jgi:hypothetical protein
MMPVAHPRRIAALLLRFAIWIAPHDTRDWGRGMLNELNHVQGNWGALIWAVGGAGVLAKHALLSVILPGSHRRTVSSASELFAKEGPMRKTTLATIASCTLASLLFFLAPVFRQAFSVSLMQWHAIFGTEDHRRLSPELEAVARKAEKNQDAEALAFVAVRHGNPSESARLADEAVHLDPNLIWVYAVVAVKFSSFPEIDRWVPALESFDPQNALPHLIAAEKIDIGLVDRRQIPHRDEENPAAWKDAMAAAFHSSKLDNYFGRLKGLDRRVLLRYGADDPYEAISGECWYGLPTYAAWDSSRYAKSLLESGETLEARGDRKGASEKYWAVARFGQMMGPAGRFSVRRTLVEAYKRLGALSEKEGNNVEAGFYASLSDQVNQEEEKELAFARSGYRSGEVSHWNAFLVKASGLAMLVSGALLLACALAVMVRGRSLRLSSLRPSRLTLALGFCGAVGSLLSSFMLYASFRPYAEIFQRFIRKGDEAGLTELSAFLGGTHVPLGVWGFLSVRDFVFYFWFGVTLLCLIVLLLVIMRYFQHRTRANATI